FCPPDSRDGTCPTALKKNFQNAGLLLTLSGPAHILAIVVVVGVVVILAWERDGKRTLLTSNRRETWQRRRRPRRRRRRARRRKRPPRRRRGPRRSSAGLKGFRRSTARHVEDKTKDFVSGENGPRNGLGERPFGNSEGPFSWWRSTHAERRERARRGGALRSVAGLHPRPLGRSPVVAWLRDVPRSSGLGVPSPRSSRRARRGGGASGGRRGIRRGAAGSPDPRRARRGWDRRARRGGAG